MYPDKVIIFRCGDGWGYEDLKASREFNTQAEAIRSAEEHGLVWELQSGEAREK